jgi:hypothetical protein
MRGRVDLSVRLIFSESSGLPNRRRGRHRPTHSARSPASTRFHRRPLAFSPELPFFAELDRARVILLTGAGGGADVFAALPLYFARQPLPM